jgi:hypothetical protein
LAISARSFRLVAARLIPRPGRCKQALTLAVLPILAGCGGSGHLNRPAVRVSGSGFAFTVPAGWKVTRGGQGVEVAKGHDLLRVATFPLVHVYRDGLFRAVEPELGARMRVLAGQSGGSLSPPTTVTVDGMRSHSYTVDDKGDVDRYTFVLRGKREYLLICRRRSSDGEAACRQLLASFRVA